MVIRAIGAVMNRVHQPHTLLVLGLNAGMVTAAGADELVEIQTRGRVWVLGVYQLPATLKVCGQGAGFGFTHLVRIYQRLQGLQERRSEID